MKKIYVLDASHEIKSIFQKEYDKTKNEIELYFNDLSEFEFDIKDKTSPTLIILCIKKDNVEKIIALRQHMKDNFPAKKNTILIMAFSKIHKDISILVGNYESSEINSIDPGQISHTLDGYLVNSE